jgi:hypothetical protein
MNACFRHEDSATFPARKAGLARIAVGRSRGRRPLLATVLVTGIAAGGSAIATADGEPGGLAALGFGATPAAAPAAPLPPAAAEPAGSDASRVIGPGNASAQTVAPKPAPERLSVWSPLQAFGLTPTPQPKPAARPQVAAAQPRPTVRPTAVESVGRFDPDFGAAAIVVADGPVAAEAVRPRAWEGQAASSPQPLQPLAGGRAAADELDEPEHSVSVSDEPVSLVGWLAGQYAGHGDDGGGSRPDVCLKDPCCKDPCCPTWEVQVDALFLWQGNIPSRPLYFDTITEQTALDANQLQNRAAIAPRYAILYHHDECRAIEANYFQVWGFNSFAGIGPTFNQAGNGAYTLNILNNAAYQNIAQAEAVGTAHIQSLEVNLRRGDRGMIEWITGFRWVEWGQGLAISDYSYQAGDPNADPPIDPIFGADQISVNTLNSLYGWQWGADMMLWNSGRWLRINGIAKAGVYYNHQALQRTYFNDGFNVVNASASEDTIAFFGETGVNCSWALTNWLSWRAGYSLFWLSGVAVPASQLSLTDVGAGTTAVNTNSSVLIHGVTTGLEARW